MKDKMDFSAGWYLFAFVGGLLSGLMFSKSQYYQGQADAYSDIAEDLEKLSSKIEHDYYGEEA